MISACKSKRDPDPSLALVSPLSERDAAEMQACSAQKKFFDPDVKICELNVDLAPFSCDRGSLSKQKGMEFYAAELAQIDVLISERFFFLECGVAKDRTVAVLAKSAQPATLRRFDFMFDGSKRSADATGQTILDTKVESLVFRGVVPCAAVKNSGGDVVRYEMRKLQLSATKSFYFSATAFDVADKGCLHDPQELLQISGQYGLGSLLGSDARGLEWEAKSVTLTLWGGAKLNEANSTRRCNVDGWQAAVAKYIQSSTCTFQVDFQKKWYQRMKADGEKLVLGKTDSAHLGDSEATRSAEWDSDFSFMREP